MRPIDADRLRAIVEESLHNNPHSDPKIKYNHISEHEHFLNLIDMIETLHYHIDEIEGYFE